MGNFSRNTFKSDKRYVSVRLQQGVPIVDADWNEAHDIRKDELETFLRLFVGDGVPGKDEFKIRADSMANDFTIGAGSCLVSGWTALNGTDVLYTRQAGVPALNTVPKDGAERTDTVYLDVWEREVDAGEDTYLVNEALGIETCVRMKREWVVRVAEGATAPPTPPEDHFFYALAWLHRKAGQGTIDDVTDLRRTGLTLAEKVDRSGDHMAGDLEVNGRLGVGEQGLGLSDPASKLVVSGPKDSSRMRVVDGVGGLTLGHWDGKHCMLESTGRPLLINSHDGGIIIGNKYPTVDLVLDTNGNIGIGTERPRTKLDVKGYGSFTSHVNLWTDDERDWQVGQIGGIPDHDFGIADEVNNTGPARMVIQRGTGNVGIGTPRPACKLDVSGSIRGGGTVDAWSKKRTGLVAFDGLSEWQEIPGLSISFTLTRSALVQLAANGAQRCIDGTIHCAYRYVVDGTPKGHPDHGQRIQVSDITTSWWSTWSLMDFDNLDAGDHTIVVEARNSTPSGKGLVCGEAGLTPLVEYSEGVFNITAIYQ